jgi:hypothetical protein
MDLKNYILLSNIEIKPSVPCYLKNPYYFIKKLGGAEDTKSYKFLHNKAFLREFCAFFGVESQKKKISAMIKNKAEDNDILNEIFDDLKPNYPNLDKIFKKIGLPADMPVYGQRDFILGHPAAEKIGENCIVVGNAHGSIPETGNIYIAGFFCETLEDMNFLKFLDFVLGKKGHKPVIFKNHIGRDERTWDLVYKEKNIKKNPLKLQVYKLKSA